MTIPTEAERQAEFFANVQDSIAKIRRETGREPVTLRIHADTLQRLGLSGITKLFGLTVEVVDNE